MPRGFTADPPVVFSTILCDTMSQAVTPDRKFTLGGVFDQFNSPAFPVMLQFMVVVMIWGVREQFELKVKLVRPMDDMTEQSVDFGMPSAVQVGEPNSMTYVVVQAPVTFAGPGRYEVRILGNESHMGYRPLTVNQLTLPPNQPGA